MKVLKTVPYLVFIALTAVGIYLLIAVTSQSKLQDYSDFIKVSSGRVLEGINKQSKQINAIDNILNVEEETIAGLEKVSGEFKTTLDLEKGNWQTVEKPKGTEEIQTQVEAFYKEAEESNKKFDEAILKIKNLEKEEDLLNTIKSYNENVSEFGKIYDELVKNLNDFINESNFLR